MTGSGATPGGILDVDASTLHTVAPVAASRAVRNESAALGHVEDEHRAHRGGLGDGSQVRSRPACAGGRRDHGNGEDHQSKERVCASARPCCSKGARASTVAAARRASASATSHSAGAPWKGSPLGCRRPLGSTSRAGPSISWTHPARQLRLRRGLRPRVRRAALHVQRARLRRALRAGRAQARLRRRPARGARARGPRQPRRQRRDPRARLRAWASTSTTAGPSSSAPPTARSCTGCAGSSSAPPGSTSASRRASSTSSSTTPIAVLRLRPARARLRARRALARAQLGPGGVLAPQRGRLRPPPAGRPSAERLGVRPGDLLRPGLADEQPRRAASRSRPGRAPGSAPPPCGPRRAR